jgi:hypothetical protein
MIAGENRPWFFAKQKESRLHMPDSRPILLQGLIFDDRRALTVKVASFDARIFGGWGPQIRNR